jgi:hypothetical protein
MSEQGSLERLRVFGHAHDCQCWQSAVRSAHLALYSSDPELVIRRLNDHEKHCKAVRLSVWS